MTIRFGLCLLVVVGLFGCGLRISSPNSSQGQTGFAAQDPLASSGASATSGSASAASPITPPSTDHPAPSATPTDSPAPDDGGLEPLTLEVRSPQPDQESAFFVVVDIRVKSDPTIPIDRLDFQLDGDWGFSIPGHGWTDFGGGTNARLDPGIHTLSVQVYDTQGRTKSISDIHFTMK